MRLKLICALAIAATAAWTGPAAGQENKLTIVLLEGEGAFNNMNRKIARNPIVEVQDENGHPVKGAAVVFTLPETGPSGTFAGGSRTYTATTDERGRAATKGFKPNATEGRFKIKITATAPGASGSAVVSQSNTLAGGIGEV